MRMWCVPPQVMCRKHLLGEHLELHMFTGAIAKGTSMAGYLASGVLDISQLESRHTALVREMRVRGYNHSSPLINAPSPPHTGQVDTVASLAELSRRCPECCQRIGRYLTLQKESENGQS